MQDPSSSSSSSSSTILIIMADAFRKLHWLYIYADFDRPPTAFSKILIEAEFEKTVFFQLITNKQNVDNRLGVLVEMLMPNFTKVHDDGLYYAALDTKNPMYRKMHNAVTEIRYLRAAFNMLKRLGRQKIHVNILFSPELRSRIYSKWLGAASVGSFTIDGQTFHEIGFSATDLPRIRLNLEHLSYEKDLASDWYDKFLASVYLHWFLSEQSHDIWKLRHDPVKLRFKSMWPGASDVIKENRWYMYDSIDFSSRPE